MCNSTPWKSEWYGRPECPPCASKPGSCRASNICYQIQCQTCLQDGKTTKYFGESGCSWCDRSREHAQALKSKNANYAIVKNWLNEHTNLEEPPTYSFKLLGTFKSAIHRQISESIIIENQDQTTIINGKEEWGTNKIQRYKLTLENQVLQESEAPKPAPDQNAKRRRSTTAGDDPFSNQYSHRMKRIRIEKRFQNASTESRSNFPTPGTLEASLKGHQ